MDEEMMSADSRHPMGCWSPAQRQRGPTVCPHWHQIFLKACMLELLLLLLLLVGLSVWVFQQTSPPPSAALHCPEPSGRNGMELSEKSSIEQYFCQQTWNSSAAPAACLLCPQFWRLVGDRCYGLSMEKGIWTRAQKECEYQQSQLVVLRNVAEKEELKEMAGVGNQPVWIGLQVSGNEWQWVDKSSFNSTDFGHLPVVENHCGTFKNSQVEEDECNGEHEWVCQKEPRRLQP
ncbi:killer cell lectin-like receptor subfamily B member 1C [Excalfactoria chinensis]|uniref:killer cell lectin-like receptor subfamily B member 1C n=1 Tax=Excalfactoria chinensis TaxID=46218 RepID=UPI003B3BC2A8